MKIRDSVLPVLRPYGGVEEVDALRESIESGWWGKGPKVARFEKEFSEMVGARYAIAVTSNTAGQDLLLKALGLKHCDVVSPTLSFMTTGVVPLWNDCTSTLVDVLKPDLNIDPEDVRKSLRSDTRCVIAVNMAGVPAAIDEIREFYDGFIIEDCAHSCYAPGLGSKGDAAVWSFQAVKTMPCGDGGMITTDDKDLYEKLVPMTWMGISSTFDRSKKDSITGRPGYSWDYEVSTLGYKCYMIDLFAAIALEQMKKLSQNLKQRRHIQQRYNDELGHLIEVPAWSETVQHYNARVPANLRNQLMDYLAEKNIHTSVHYKPLHKHPILQQNRSFPVADAEWVKLITLPCHAGVSDEDITYVIYWVKAFFEAQD